MNKELRTVANGGMNSDDAIEQVLSPDYPVAWNLRTTGTADQEAGYGTNIESGEPIELSLPAGINKGLGITGFPDVRKLYSFRFNSQGYHQLIEIDGDTNQATVLFTNLTDSNNIDILSLNSKSRIDDMVLINGEFLAWTDGGAPHMVSLKALKNGEYAPVLEEDFSLIKPQNLKPIGGVYTSDMGRTSNLLYGKLFQFISQNVGKDYHYSAWSTISKRILPQQESTPTVTMDVSKNNAIIVYVDAGNSRTKTIRVGARYDNLGWFVIKTVDRSYITSLTNTAINLSTEVYEAFNPATNTYSFLFYNDGLYEPIAATETDLAYDYVPRFAAAVTLVNDNIIALGDVTEGYPLPSIKANFKSVSYQPDLQITNNTNTNPFRVSRVDPGGVGSGLGNHRRLMRVIFTGVPRTGDVWTIVLYDIRDANQTKTYSYTVKSVEDGSLDGVVGNSSPIIPWNSVISPRVSATETGFEFRGDPYYEVQSASVKTFNQGSGVTKAIRALKSSSSYQAGISYRDKFGRFFPLVTGNDFVFKTASYAQTLGGSPALQWSIQESAPDGAVDFQILLSKNTSHQSNLYINGAVINYKGQWDAKNNSPALAVNSGTVGDTWLIIQPKTGDSNTNLGGNSTVYQSGDFVVYNGLSWDVISKDFGDLASTASYLFFKINPLLLFNRKNSKVGDSVLNYQFSKGDRCTFDYYTTDNINKTWFNSPNVDVQVEGFDPSTYILKVRSAVSLVPDTLSGKDVLMELYTPLKRTDVSTDNTTDNNSDTVFYEIGERYTITNGKHDTLSGTITGGDVYYKSRELAGAADPNKLFTFLVEDFNFSDFYISNYTSYGRPRTVLDTPETTEKKAVIRYSDVYVLGSKNNGLTRFYPNRVYGEGDGETSSSYGAIRKMYQRGNVLMIFQDAGIGYIPVFSTILEDQAEQQQLAVSDRLFNKIRYNTSNIGMGRGKSSFAVKDADCFFVDTNRSEPVRAGLDGVGVISGKMSKFFKQKIKAAVIAGYNVSGYYDTYNEEYVVVIETNADVIENLTFNTTSWKIIEDYTVPASAISIAAQPTNGSVTYNSSTGKATLTPDPNYTGSISFKQSFNIGSQVITKNVCGRVIDGVINVNQFYFDDVDNASLSTQYVSNAVFVSGNNIPVPVSIIGGEYSINNGAWQTVQGQANSGDDIRVRLTSSGVINTSVSATLTVSDKSDSYDVKTYITATNINYEVDEAANPYADANLRIFFNDNELKTINGTETGTLSVGGGGTFKFQAFSELQSTGSSPSLTMTVTDMSNSLVYTETQPIPPNGMLTFNRTQPSGMDLNVKVSSSATGGSQFKIYNNYNNASVQYRLNSSTYDSGIQYINPYDDIDPAALLAGISGDNKTIFVYAATDNTVVYSIPDNSLINTGNQGALIYSATPDSITQSVADGMQGVRVYQDNGSGNGQEQITQD